MADQEPTITYRRGKNYLIRAGHIPPLTPDEFNPDTDTEEKERDPVFLPWLADSVIARAEIEQELEPYERRN
jgi:hypothetical protein